MTSIRGRFTSFGTAMAVSAFALMTVLAPASMDAAYAADVEQLLGEARAYKAEGRVADSMIQIKNVLQQEPANAAANALMGVLYLDTGDVARGQLQLERARDLGGAPEDWMIPLLRAWLATGATDSVLELTENLPDTLTARLRSDALSMRGRALAANGDGAAAREAFQQAMAVDPSAALAQAGLARMEQADGNLAAAEDLARAALSADPEEADVLYLAADLALARGDLDEAISYFQTIKDIKPVNPFVRVPLSRALVTAGRLDEAAEELDWVLSRVSGYPEALYLRGHVAYQQNDFTKADRLLSEMLASNPTDEAAQILGGLVKFRLDQHEQAVRLLSGVAEQDGVQSQARLALGASLLRTGEAERAYEVLAPMRDAMNGDAEALTLLGEAARMTERLDEALEILNAANTLKPDDPRILRLIASVQSALGRSDAGLEALADAVEKDPTDTEAVSTYYAMLLQNNRVAEALAVADKVVADYPEQARGHTMRGLALLATRDLEGAEAAFREALKVEPTAMDAAGNLASLLRMANRDEEARTVLLEAHEAMPNDSGPMLRLAEIASANGDMETARTWLERAVQTDGAASEPRARLGQLLLSQGRADAALATVLPALAETPRDVDLLTVAAEARLRTGQAANAVQTARTLAEVRPNLASYRLLVNVAQQAGDTRALRTGLEGIATVQPENMDIHLALAQLALAEDDINAARKHVESAHALAPEDPRVIHLEAQTRLALDASDGIVYLRSKIDGMDEPPGQLVVLLANAERASEPERASARLMEWVAAHPDDTRTKVLLSMWHIEDKRFDDARAVLEDVLQAVPEHWVSHNNLAYVLMQSGELDKALEHATQARKLGGDQPELLDTEGQIRLRMDDPAMAEKLFRQAASQTSRTSHRLNLAEALVALERDDDAREVLEQIDQSRAGEAERARARELLARLSK